MKRSRIALLCLGLGFTAFSCDSDQEVEDMASAAKNAMAQSMSEMPLLHQGIADSTALQTPSNLAVLSENARALVINKAVAPSACAPTQFAAVQTGYLTPLYSDPYALNYFNLYLDLNFYAAYFDRSPQYFGANGEYTQLVTKRQRDLEKFWDMANQIRVNGQHNATLNDRERLADVYELVGTNVNTREQALAIADIILSINQLSPNLPESPFFSSDGFAASNKLIVMGDGLVKMVSESGVDAEIVWTGILAHEWAHQIQFKNMSTWYPNGADRDRATATRYTELEADFLASYYMTHKRGATFNWKRVQQFLQLYFQIGDCAFASPGHHGTPAQRMAAAQLGYELANEAQKQGHILTQQEAHAYFVSKVGSIL